MIRIWVGLHCAGLEARERPLSLDLKGLQLIFRSHGVVPPSALPCGPR